MKDNRYRRRSTLVPKLKSQRAIQGTNFHSPLAVKIAMLFFRDIIRKYGGKGLMSVIDSLRSCNSAVGVGTGVSPGTLWCWSCFSGSSVGAWSFEHSGRVIVDSLEHRTRSREARRRCKIAQYVRLRSCRNVSLNKIRKEKKMTPPQIVRKKKLARQFKPCVSDPPSIGPSAGPKRGAAQKMPITAPRS